MVPAARKQPTVYQITVSGRLEPDWSECLGGLAITTKEYGAQTTTTLCGELTDQAALMGVLNNLYGLGFLILAVEHQSVPNKEKIYVGL